ncbi:MAG: hypothetical protein KBS74_01220 [Clostridiales bacterium]|nr:hypothetical protein [Candidatus Cacconaster stercorequi]
MSLCNYITDTIMKEWKQGQDQNSVWEQIIDSLPTCDLTPEELTTEIRKIAPGYHFDSSNAEKLEAGEKLTEKVRDAIRKNAEHGVQSEYWKLATEIFDARAGDSFGAYIENFMPEKLESMREIAKLNVEDPAAAREKLKVLHREVMENVMTNKEVQEIRQQLGSLTLDKTAENWQKISAVCRIGDAQNTFKRYKEWYTADEQKKYQDTLDNAFNKGFTLESKMSIQASNIGYMVDVDQLAGLSTNQLFALMKNKEIFQTNSGNDPFMDAYTCALMPWNNLHSKAEDLFETKFGDPLMVQGVDGKPIKDSGELEEACFEKNLPVYVLPKSKPDADPVLAYVNKEGKVFLGEEAKIMFADSPMMPKPQPPKKLTGITGWFSRTFNTASNKRYQADLAAYEAKMTEYNQAKELKSNIDRLDSPEALRKIKEEMYRTYAKTTVAEYAEKKKIQLPPDKAATFEGKLRSSGLSPTMQKTLLELHNVLEEEKGRLENAGFDPDDEGDLRMTCANAMVCRTVESILDREIDRLVKEQPTHPVLSPELVRYLPDDAVINGTAAEIKDDFQTRLGQQVKGIFTSGAMQKMTVTADEVQAMISGSGGERAKAVDNVLKKFGQQENPVNAQNGQKTLDQSAVRGQNAPQKKGGSAKIG